MAEPFEDQGTDADVEVDAIRIVLNALKSLDVHGQRRVLEYVMKRLDIAGPMAAEPVRTPAVDVPPDDGRFEPRVFEGTLTADNDEEKDEKAKGDLQAINPVAQKWLTRNGVSPSQLTSLFSLDIDGDDIDLVTSSVPGKNKSERLRSVVLLKSVASYLGSGAARVDQKKLKEAASHYDADVGNNMPTNMKNMAAEVSGTAATGFSLTSRGLTAAMHLIKQILKPASTA